jgi:diaminohydroxyphosphoribosylaminopyrimidine deaminase/5-amino-6-(5-phosphoribosylamino)uracil reductase
MPDSPASWSAEDLAFMDRALELGAAMLGRTAPNPSVGAVLVRDGRIVGEGATQPGGRPHAEAMALAMAGPALVQGATAYVTLEPCAHASPRGPDCTGSLIAAGLLRCVVALTDPDPRTAGAGVARLRAAGTVVDVGCRAREARTAHAGFLSRLATGRPLVAESADGASFDDRFQLGFRETFEDALDRYGAAGATRLWVPAGSALALALAARGLVWRPD